MKLRRVYLVAFVALALITLAFAAVTMQSRSNEFGESASLVTSSQQYTLEVVTTAKDKSRGLSGRPSIPQNQGMLFVYDQEAVRCFWMKDMNFPLDIIWISGRREVVHIEKNLSPDTYPKSFCPQRGATYVVELNANEVDRVGINLGDRLDF